MIEAASGTVAATTTLDTLTTLPSAFLAASGVDWSEVHAVRLLGLALGALILLWAIRRMFGRRR